MLRAPSKRLDKVETRACEIQGELERHFHFDRAMRFIASAIRQDSACVDDPAGRGGAGAADCLRECCEPKLRSSKYRLNAEIGASGCHPCHSKKTQNRIIDLICPFLPPRVFVKCPSIRKMNGRGGGDRKLNLLSQVLSCQRRSSAALLPIGVKWCQVSRPTRTGGPAIARASKIGVGMAHRAFQRLSKYSCKRPWRLDFAYLVGSRTGAMLRRC